MPGQLCEQFTRCRQHLPEVEDDDELTVLGTVHASNVSIVAV
jgi:hypothetical protein